MFNRNRDSARQVFIGTWKKYLEKRSLETLEQQVLAVILEHPEYHEILSDQQSALTEEYAQEEGRSNPFLHMGMHIAIREQVSGNRPAGIAAVYESLLAKHSGDCHTVEHLMQECLGEALLSAWRNGTQPDDNVYLNCLRNLC